MDQQAENELRAFSTHYLSIKKLRTSLQLSTRCLKDTLESSTQQRQGRGISIIEVISIGRNHQSALVPHHLEVSRDRAQLASYLQLEGRCIVLA